MLSLHQSQDIWFSLSIDIAFKDFQRRIFSDHSDWVACLPRPFKFNFIHQCSKMLSSSNAVKGSQFDSFMVLLCRRTGKIMVLYCKSFEFMERYSVQNDFDRLN